MTNQPNPILFKLSADVASREAHQLFKSGQIDAGEYSRILSDCRQMERQAGQIMAVLVPQRRERGASYEERKF